MDFELFNNAYKAIKILKSQDDLRQIKIISYPSLKDDSARNQIYRELFKDAYPDIFEEKRPVSTNDLAKLMGIKNGK